MQREAQSTADHSHSNSHIPRTFKMHKIVLVTLAVFAVTMAFPQQQPQQPQQPQHPVYILKQDADVHPDGYNFAFQTSDGTSRQETGTLKQISEDHKAIQVQGQYAYVAPDGLVYTITYTADEHGFQPQEHISAPQ